MRRKQQKEITRTPQVLSSNGTIRVCDVEKYYGTDNNVTKAVDRVSFTVQKGEFTGIMGASGSGKTTLLNMISTIDHVTSGHIYYGNVDITELNEDALAEFRKENLGFVFQDYNLLDTLTIEENIVLAMTLHSQNRKEIRKKCDEILKLLQIDEIRDKFPYQVSGGQKQRCACARALIHHPQLRYQFLFVRIANFLSIFQKFFIPFTTPYLFSLLSPPLFPQLTIYSPESNHLPPKISSSHPTTRNRGTHIEKQTPLCWCP